MVISNDLVNKSQGLSRRSVVTFSQYIIDMIFKYLFEIQVPLITVDRMQCKAQITSYISKSTPSLPFQCCQMLLVQDF